jgi:hypothetical protein
MNNLNIIYLAVLRYGMELKSRQIDTNNFIIEDMNGLLEIHIDQYTKTIHRNPFDIIQESEKTIIRASWRLQSIKLMSNTSYSNFSPLRKPIK